MSKGKIAKTSDRLREAMTSAGKKQADLVRETGLDRGSISSYLSDKYEPKQNAINKLAIALGVSEMWLWGYDVPKERTAEQKKNDVIVDIVMKLRKDDELLSMMEQISKLDVDKRKAIKFVLNTYEVTEK